MTEVSFAYVGGPARYPAPDWDAIGRVARVWVPDAETVGWIVWQDPDRLAWISAAHSLSSLAAPVGDFVRTLVAEGATTGRPARAVWDDVLARTLHTTPTDEFLPAFTADVRAGRMS